MIDAFFFSNITTILAIGFVIQNTFYVTRWIMKTFR